MLWKPPGKTFSNSWQSILGFMTQKHWIICLHLCSLHLSCFLEQLLHLCVCVISRNYKLEDQQGLSIKLATAVSKLIHSFLPWSSSSTLLAEREVILTIMWTYSIQQLKKVFRHCWTPVKLTFSCNSLNSVEVIFSGCTKVKLSTQVEKSVLP